MGKRLVLDLNKCDTCEKCSVKCGYFYRARPTDQGINTLRERATFLLVCRRCEDASCIRACPFEALERQEDGVVKRYNLRCVSCNLCVQACPFGTIHPNMVLFYQTPCDYCVGQNGGDPPCVANCVKNGIEYREVDPSEKDLHIVDDHLAVKAHKWEKKETDY